MLCPTSCFNPQPVKLTSFQHTPTVMLNLFQDLTFETLSLLNTRPAAENPNLQPGRAMPGWSSSLCLQLGRFQRQPTIAKLLKINPASSKRGLFSVCCEIELLGCADNRGNIRRSGRVALTLSCGASKNRCLPCQATSSAMSLARALRLVRL